ncbi:BTB/POZ domain-containing protein [Phthorimaea operculella]|nr:BTB/POZ domain-containing protein [Phthorimaea operculella]
MAPREPESTDWQVNYPEIKMRSAHLLRSGEWADCSFQFESGAGEAAPSLAAHRLILAMASPVFAAMFYGRVGDKEEPIHISDIDHAVFSSMLDYIYTDEVEITSLEMASELFRAANKYILVHLERKCINYLLENLSPQKACYIYELSCMYNEEELKTKCVEFFRTNTLDVIKANTFKDAQFETLKTIYSLDTLSIDSELDLFEALVEYTKYNKEIQSLEDNTMQANGESQQVKNETDTNNESTDAGHLIKKDEKKRIKAVTRVSSIMEEIRFLTVPPEKFGECPLLHALLSKDEILALSMNLLSANSTIPLPAGFSTSRMPRNKGSKGRSFCTQQIIVKNLSSLTKYESKIFCVNNVPWMVEMQPFYREKEKRIQVDLVCLLELKQPWTLKTQLGIRVVPVTTNALNMSEITRTISTEISRDNDGIQTSFSWKMLTNPAFGVSRGDDSLHMEIYVAIEDLKILNTEEKKYEVDLYIPISIYL